MSMYRGLSTFISDLRACKTKEAEQGRVDKELANVRKAFSGGTMTPYDRKKYVWKLVYVNMMGYDVDFGTMEMIALLSSPSYAEKLVGYMAVSVMLRNTDSNMPLVIQAIKMDLTSTQDPIQCLALCAIANIGGKALAEECKDDVVNILFSRSIFPVVRKKAALCLTRLTRVNRDLQLSTDEWRNKLTPLLEDKNMGVVLSVVSLILGLAEAAGKEAGAYDGCTSHLLVLLTKLAVRKEVTEDYLYYTVACPWLQVKILRLLQQFPVPALERNRSALNELLTHILSRTEITKNINENNAKHCVLFEAVALVIRQGDLALPGLREKSLAHLSRFINIKEPNIRYLGLNAMAAMLGQEGADEVIRKQTQSIMFSLKDADISVRRRALALLFALCNTECAVDMVKDLLSALALADFQFRDELVLKIAILSERYSPSLNWYVDTVVTMISIAGDHVGDDVWHRLVQVVTNGGESAQGYAAAKLYGAVESAAAHETAIKAGAYILAEFGHLINDAGVDGGDPVSGARQFAAVHQHFPKCSTPTKCILLSAYAKMRNLYPELDAIVVPVFEAHTSTMDSELQQRAVEYLALPSLSENDLCRVLDAMPRFPERASHLEEKLKKLEEEKGDKDVWGEETSLKGGRTSPTTTGSGGSGDVSAVALPVSSSSSSSSSSSGSSSNSSSSSSSSSSSADLLGLDGFDSGPSPPAPAAAAAQVDPLSVPVTKTIGLDGEAKGRMPGQLGAAIAKGSGVLYEDGYLQVGAKRGIEGGGAGTLTLFLGNRSTTLTLWGIKLRFPDSPGVSVALQGGVASLPTSIPPGTQAKVVLSVSASGPFTEAPPAYLSFISAPGTGHAYILPLPLSPTSFTTPAPLPPADFKTRWGALAGAPREVTALITPKNAAAAPPSREVAQAALAAAARLECLDITPTAATGAGVFRTTTLGPAGTPLSVGVLVMCIPDAGAGVYKCAVRTQVEAVSKAVMAVIQTALEAAQ